MQYDIKRIRNRLLAGAKPFHAYRWLTIPLNHIYSATNLTETPFREIFYQNRTSPWRKRDMSKIEDLLSIYNRPGTFSFLSIEDDSGLTSCRILSLTLNHAAQTSQEQFLVILFWANFHGVVSGPLPRLTTPVQHWSFS